MITISENIAFLTAWQSWRQGISQSHLMPMTSPEQLDQHIEFSIETLKMTQQIINDANRIEAQGE